MTSSLEEAEEARVAGDVDAIVRIVTSCLVSDADGIEWIRFALRCRDAGSTDIAKTVLRLVIQKMPELEAGYLELAFLHRLCGEHREAIGLLLVAASLTRADFRTHLFLGHMLYSLGAHPEADRTLAAVTPKTLEERQTIDAMFAFGRYLGNHPLGRSLAMLDTIKLRYPWLEAPALAEQIKTAIHERRPFALVRLGDGEGGMLPINSRDEFLYQPLYERNRQELISMWFGNAFLWRTNGFFNLAQGLLDTISECDVIGLPYESWLRHEYSISSLRGVPSLVNVYRALLDRVQTAPRAICSQLAHLELHTGGHLASIIASVSEVSVISCLADLPERLKQRFGLREVMLYRIPGEQGSRHILGEAAVEGTHYPDRFRELQSELARPHNGRLFLVAGGLLGKVYAAIIRRHGGIALDVGSIVDGWTGRATRPGYDQRLCL